jgi:hypothetical protein
MRAEARAAARKAGGRWRRHIHPANNATGCLCHEAAADAAGDVWEAALNRDRKEHEFTRRELHLCRRRLEAVWEVVHRVEPAGLFASPVVEAVKKALVTVPLDEEMHGSVSTPE